MNFCFHTTSGKMRHSTISSKPHLISTNSVGQILPVSDPHTIVYDQHNDKIRRIDFSFMYETLKHFEKFGNKTAFENTPYVKVVGKNGVPARCRRARLYYNLFCSIRDRGFDKNNPIDVELSGERLDGGHRAVVCNYLGLQNVPVRIHMMKWNQVSESYLKRKLLAEEMEYGENYYYIDFGNGLTRPTKVRPVLIENGIERWNGVLKQAIGNCYGQRILDLGCNAGFIDMQCKFAGAGYILGIDRRFASTAWTTKLVYEYVFKNEIQNIDFVEGDIARFIPEDAFDICLMLNILYHLPKEDQIMLLHIVKNCCKKIVIQGNDRKAGVKYGATIPEMKELLSKTGWTITATYQWKQKPVIVAKT